MGDEDLNRLGKVDELCQSMADPAIVRQFVAELEVALLAEATELMQAEKYETALRKYMLATRLPDRTFKREELILRALYALGFVLNNGKKFQDVECLRDPIFEIIARELKERFENGDHRAIAERRAHFDGQPLLLKKDFDTLETLDRESPLPLTPDIFASRLRLAREKEAQGQLLTILEKLEQASKESDAEKRRAIIEGEVHVLMDSAVEKAGAPYAGQIRDYVERVTNLLFVSRTEPVLNEISDSGARLRRDAFTAFENGVQAEADVVAALRAIVAAMKSFRSDELLPEVERVAAHWVEEVAKVRLKILAAKEPERARTAVTESIRLIEAERSVLPPAVAVDYRDFLAGVACGPDPSATPDGRPQPEPKPEPAPPPLKPREGFGGWLARIFGRRRTT